MGTCSPCRKRGSTAVTVKAPPPRDVTVPDVESPSPQLIVAANSLAVSDELGSVNEATVPVNGTPATAEIGAAVICVSDEP